MSPVKVLHSLYQGKIEFFLRTLLKTGEALPECAIQTQKGTKVADVAWVSKERLEQIKYETQCSIAPEICVEVLSESNTDEEMIEKRKLYIENGAKEVWVCSEEGEMEFFNSQGKIEKSLIVPEFPPELKI